jgi:hypothetical protein
LYAESPRSNPFSETGSQTAKHCAKEVLGRGR